MWRRRLDFIPQLWEKVWDHLATRVEDVVEERGDKPEMGSLQLRAWSPEKEICEYQFPLAYHCISFEVDCRGKAGSAYQPTCFNMSFVADCSQRYFVRVDFPEPSLPQT